MLHSQPAFSASSCLLDRSIVCTHLGCSRAEGTLNEWIFSRGKLSDVIQTDVVYALAKPHKAIEDYRISPDKSKYAEAIEDYIIPNLKRAEATEDYAIPIDKSNREEANEDYVIPTI